jgi:CYTH domain-containing protein
MPAEIERVFLLRGMPVPMPEGVSLRIEQGYLPPSAGDALEGRTEHVHTVKRGSGLVREEHERPMAADEFAREWPRTEGRRIAKVRTKVRVGDRTWEIDRFDGLPVVLAECELPSVDAPLEVPAWLAPWIEREVTEEPAFRNFELARRAGLLHHP